MKKVVKKRDRSKLLEFYGFPKHVFDELLDIGDTNDQQFVKDLLSFLSCIINKDCDGCNLYDSPYRDDPMDCDCCECLNNPPNDKCNDKPKRDDYLDKVSDDRDLEIRCLNFPYFTNLHLITMSRGLSDKEFISRMLAHLHELQENYGDLVPGASLDCGEESIEYWKERAYSLEDELTSVNSNREDDYDEKVSEIDELESQIRRLDDKFDFFVNTVEMGVSFDTTFYCIKRNSEIIDVCLTNCEAIDKTASLNATGRRNEVDDSHYVVNFTLLKLCVNYGNSGVEIVKLLSEKLSLLDDSNNCSSDNVVAIRKKVFKS